MSGQAKSGGPAVRLAITAGIGACVAAVVVVLLDARVPASGYMHPEEVPAWHLWMGLVVGFATATGLALVMFDEGRLGRGSRPLLAFLVALQVWPLAFLAALALGSRFAAAGAIVGAIATFGFGAGLLLWLGRQAGRQWPGMVPALHSAFRRADRPGNRVPALLLGQFRLPVATRSRKAGLQS
jgi:hypothetical protein